MPSGGDITLEDGPGYVLAAAGTVNEDGDEEEDVVARSSNGSDKNEEGCEEGEYLESVSPTTTTVLNDDATPTADEKCLNAEGASVYSLAIPANPANISGSPTTPGNTAGITGAAEAMADSVVAIEMLRDSTKVRNHFTFPLFFFFLFLSSPPFFWIYAPIPFGHIEAALGSVSLTSYLALFFFFHSSLHHPDQIHIRMAHFNATPPTTAIPAQQNGRSLQKKLLRTFVHFPKGCVARR